MRIGVGAEIPVEKFNPLADAPGVVFDEHPVFEESIPVNGSGQEYILILIHVYGLPLPINDIRAGEGVHPPHPPFRVVADGSDGLPDIGFGGIPGDVTIGGGADGDGGEHIHATGAAVVVGPPADVAVGA